MKKLLFALLGLIVSGSVYAALPDGYTQLEYIESNGSQYITMPAFPNASNIDVTVDVQHTTGTNEQIFFAPETDSIQYLYTISDQWRVWKSNKIGQNIGTGSDRHIFTIKTTPSSVEYYTDGEKITAVPADTFNSGWWAGRTFKLGARTKTNGSGDFFWNGKIYSFKATCDGQVCIDLVPAKHGDDIGMYDLASDTFIRGTGTFEAGSDAVTCPHNGTMQPKHQSGLPLGYTKLDKITFDGGYIVTDIYPNLDTEFVIDAQKTSDSLVWLFGARTYAGGSTTATDKYGLQGISSATNTLWLQIDSTSKLEYNSVAVTSSQGDRLARHTYGIKNRRIVFDGQEVEWGGSGVPDATAFTASNPLIIGGIQSSDGTVSTARFLGDLYSATGLILCKRVSDNAIGVYNTATGVFSAGTGTLTAGNAVSDPVITQCVAPIKLATTKYNNTAFQPVLTALNNAVSTIKDVVANTINQATAVANLQSGKQTKPTDTCPSGKTCLLVEDENGTPHWYEIIERAPGIVPAGSGYTQVAYLQSDGHQYIDTGITPNASYRYTIKWQPTSATGVNGSNTYKVFGSDGVTGGESITLGHANTQNFYWVRYNTAANNSPSITDTFGLNMIDVTATEGSITINGTTRSQALEQNLSANSNNVYLFCTNASGASMFAIGKIYTFQIYNDESLVQDLVPARRNSDGVLGMYDTVSDTFFTNAGSGTFIDDTGLASGYRRLQYLENTSDSWIDTGINGFDSGEWEIYAKWMATASTQPNSYGFIFGVYKGETYKSYRLIFNQTNSGKYYVSANSKAGGGSLSVDAAINTVHEITVRNGAFTLDGTNYNAANSGDPLPAAATLGIFTSGRADSPSYATMGLGRIYEMRVTKNGALVANFIPVQNSSGVKGMYNLADTNPSTAFFSSRGSAAFGGPLVQ